MRIKTLLSAIVVSALCFSGQVQAAGKEDAAAFADSLGKKAVKIISDASLSKDKKRVKLETLFQDHVDIDWIGQFVLGRNWKQSTEDQKQQYLHNYRTYLVKHYTSNLSDFNDANFDISRVQPEENGKGYIVTMHVKRPKAEDAIVDYVVRKKDDSFMVYDIIVEGVSMITTQRSEFGAVVAQNDINYLISQLAERSKSEKGLVSSK